MQRNPATDKTRVHTSTATVAVLPTVPAESAGGLPEIPESELVIETTRARGAGGQHVNTTDSAIRVTHVPTGVVVSIQDDRSQHRNRAQAMQIVRAKVGICRFFCLFCSLLLASQVAAIRRAERDRERADSRRAMIGTGDRSERIRTYNFPQDRVTDHRVNFSVSGVEEMLRGLRVADFAERLRHADLRQRLHSHFAAKT